MAQAAALLRAKMARDVDEAEPTTTDIQRLRQCADELLKLDLSIVRVEQELDTLTRTRRTLAEVTIPTLFDEMGGVSKITLEDGRAIELKTEVHPAVTLENQPKFYAWLKAHKFDSIIKNEVKSAFGRGEDALAKKVADFLKKSKIPFEQKRFIHPMTFKAFVKERLDQGGKLPPTVDVNAVRTTKITSKKG